MKTIRIACASGGCTYERLEPAIEVLEKGNLDYIVFECLAERTIANAQMEKLKDPTKGYNPMLEERMRALLPLMRENKVKLISNMGGANTPAAVERIVAIAKELGLDGLKVGMVEGDDITRSVARYADTPLWEGSQTLGELCGFAHQGAQGQRNNHGTCGSIVSANAYLSGDPIAEALAKGAEMVITGRVADASLFVGPLKHEFGWDYHAPEHLGQAILLGHLLECANQLTGGYYADPGYKDIPGLHILGFPIAQIDASGEFCISKVEGSGGRVCVDICKEQLLYEIGDSAAYITPDGIVDFSRVTFEQCGENRVMARHATASPAPDTYKVNIGYQDCFVGEASISYGGKNALPRAKLAAEIIEKRLHLTNVVLDEFRVDLMGCNSLYRDHISRAITAEAPAEVRMRVAGRASTADAVRKMTREVECLYINGPAGGGGIRSEVGQVVSVENICIPRSDITPTVTIIEV